MKYKKTGWFGNPHGHALAARGIKLYAKKQQHLVDPLFYAKKNEEKVPFTHIKDMAREGSTFNQMMAMHPDADKEDMRLRGIKAIESVEGGNTLSTIDRNGTDTIMKMVEHTPRFAENTWQTLNDAQKVSFLPQPKVEMLKRRVKAWREKDRD